MDAATSGREQLNTAMAAGLITAQQAQEQLELELRIRPLVAQASVAQGEAQDELNRKVAETIILTMASNKVQREAQIIAGNRDKKDALRLLEREIELMGASNATRAVELAQLAERQRLGADAESPAGKRSIDLAGQLGGAQADAGATQDNYNRSLDETLDLLTQIETQAKAAASGLADSFGSAGNAVTGLTVALIESARTQEQLARQRTEDRKAAEVSENASAAAKQLSAQRLAQIEATYARQFIWRAMRRPAPQRSGTILFAVVVVFLGLVSSSNVLDMND